MLVNLPVHAADSYPVETVHAVPNTSCHLARQSTEVFATMMVTYGNGELCSKLLCNAVNRDYLHRLKCYCSIAKEKKGLAAAANTTNCVEKDGEFIKQFPPFGDSIRDMYDTAASSVKNPWCVSDHDRHVREIQSVNCDSTFAQDHTFQVTKNYQNKGGGAVAVWDAATATGEIASAVLVPSTKPEDFAHAAQQLLKRPMFKPKVKCSDTWPSKKEFWQSVCPGIEGRRGLFHYQKRIVSTLRKNHVDYNEAVTHLLAALYEHCSDDYERLLSALKNGTLSRTGKKYSSSEIADMKRTNTFRERYSKYLRKKLHQHETICQNLDDWFCRFKVTASEGSRPAGGRLDPIRFEPLFTADTKQAIQNCKEKAMYISDPLPLQDMYDEILPNPNSSHQLVEYLSLRGESKLEAFHDRFAHFANCGMRASLADNLNLAGTARYNLSIRHKRSRASSKNPIENPMSSPECRKKIPVGWERVVPCFNHSELSFVNQLAADVGCRVPFPYAEVLPEDNGERFFSEHMSIVIPSLSGVRRGEYGECMCALCKRTSTKTVVFAVASPTKTPPRATMEIVTGNNEVSITTTSPPQQTTINNVNSNVARRHASLPPGIANQIANGAHNSASRNLFGAPVPPVAIAPQLIPMQFQLPFCCNCNFIVDSKIGVIRANCSQR